MIFQFIVVYPAVDAACGCNSLDNIRSHTFIISELLKFGRDSGTKKSLFVKAPKLIMLCESNNFQKLAVMISALCSGGNNQLKKCYLYFSKAHPLDRRYSARIKASNVCNTWAPVNPIIQGTSCAG